MVRSNSSTRVRVSPMSTPMTWPYSGFMPSIVRGRPPSDSASPVSMTMPSSISSRITFVTEAALSPVAALSSCLLRAWLR